MREQFEVRAHDAAGRVGELTVPRAGVTVETPALLPVVNPNILTVEPSRLAEEFGAEILITNSYIVRNDDDLRARAEREGLHEMLGFDGAIMTDSGSFQLAEYGEISVTTREILEFQREVGSDIGTPVDIPTPPDAGRERAEADLETTAEALADAAAVETGEMLVNAPVQGSVYPDLRERAGRQAAATDLDVFPVGAVVPLMNAYRYDDMVDAVAAAKRGLDADCPVHLFGAGHPMMFALAVALGCDLFDSAAYAIYARDGRYLTVSGTEHLSELEYLPCSCPICHEHSPDDLRAAEGEEFERLLAEHNLHVTFEEMRRVKQAVRDGDLLELVEKRARGHPAMVDGYRALLDHSAQLERADSASKGAFFALSHESARRPEVTRHHDRLGRLSTPDRLLCSEYGAPSDHEYDAVWRVVPPFGPFPRALSETYPLTAETPDRTDAAAERAAAEGVAALADANPASEVTLAHDGWGADALDRLPGSVATEDLSGLGSGEGE
ncbi:tRNA guanosine(15) transglycosylase TgtA [Candidatus Halobonum tyrrellensis]|uniref:tRNA-guanine(15) transglycosylase n=1 Tax=Candidatus Halobonum tyrrellensis G22 TaxID=1324957 RepID=V4J028_9EURY|nr:tRNA guanosine(15) transglycosylase TgtA [Candidatus Halobonum tyrrellensis]ESP88787.1 7-cyano-7-deazaguanine tRNA-ribosyltransferase [Candidatus Halobonum tyrrellensis G22]